MYRKLAAVTIFVLVLSMAFASVSFAQTGTGNQGTTQSQTNQNNNQANQGGTWNSAYTNLGGTRTLRAGQQEWFAFQYAGDNSPIQIRLRNASNVQFSVWTQQDIQNANGNFGMAANPVGRSTANDQFGGDQYWTGSFNAPGTYYVLVENSNGGQGGRYSLEVTGTGVSWRGAGNQGNNSTSASGAGNNTSGSNNTSAAGNNTNSSNNTSTTGNNTNSSTSAQGGVAPSTLPTTGGEMASVFPMLLGGMGALSVAAGALLRRKK